MQLREVAARHRPHTDGARRAYLGPEDTVAVSTDDLLHRLKTGQAVVLDVRPEPGYAAAHLPGALHIPLEDLADRLTELPRIVACCRGQYCVMAHDAVRLLTRHGYQAHRAADGVLEWRMAGVPLTAAADDGAAGLAGAHRGAPP